MNKVATEITLVNWRFGQTKSERLCADLLQVEGFKDIDPQCPLGGPDDRKDILCLRDGKNWLVAAYFPSSQLKFKDVKNKFCDDFEGVERHNRQGFVFLTNQPLKPAERTELTEHARPIPVELYHLERIRSILDSPKGYGFRLEYLQIPMTMEEQLSFFSIMKDNITEKLIKQESHHVKQDVKIDDMGRDIKILLARTMMNADNITSEMSSLEKEQPRRFSQLLTADLKVEDIFWLHNILSDENRLLKEHRNKFRSIPVWIGQVGSTPETARFTPPPPNQIEELLTKLITNWHSKYSSLVDSEESEQIASMATFHHCFVSIHPFVDGNGRVARALLQQQAFELTGRNLDTTFTKYLREYFDSLSAADAGNLSNLENLIKTNFE